MQPWQEEALPYLDKLFDPLGNRQTGRTYLLAVAFIRAACRNPTHNIPFIDHHANNRRAIDIIRLYVETLVHHDSALAPYYRANELHFHLNLPEPIMDWRPEELGEGPTFWDRLVSD